MPVIMLTAVCKNNRTHNSSDKWSPDTILKQTRKRRKSSNTKIFQSTQDHELRQAPGFLSSTHAMS